MNMKTGIADLPLKRSGIVELRLAAGPVPHYKEIVKLSGPIMAALVNEFGTEKTIKRFSDPLWFNCYACTVGFEWQFSGLTTVPLMATKEALEKENIGVRIVGGKGKKSKAMNEIAKVGEELNIRTKEAEQIEHASRLTCKVDTCELQDNHQLYFHSMILDEKGNFITINQKMNVDRGTVRRFHWIPNPKQFVEEPYNAAIGKKENSVIDLTSKNSRECRNTITDIVKDTKPENLHKTILSLDKKITQSKIIEFAGMKIAKMPYHLQIPKRLSLGALKNAHELSSKNFESLLGVIGIGPATIRGLVYVSDLIYGTSSSFKDPIKYTFAFGTKAGIPYPVEKKAMIEVSEILHAAIENAKLGNKEKLDALRRLKDFLPDNSN